MSRKKLTPLLAAVLFAGGTRREKPIYCHRAIVSFPLDNFLYDILSHSASINSIFLVDSTFVTSDADVLSSTYALTGFELLGAVLQATDLDAVSSLASIFSMSVEDVVKISDTNIDIVSCSYGIVLGDFNLNDNVKVSEVTPVVVSTSYTISLFELGAP